MDEEHLINNIAICLRDILYNRGLTDLSNDSIDFCFNIIINLSRHNINAIGTTGWFYMHKYEDKIPYMYVKAILSNGKKIYIDAFRGDKVIYKTRAKEIKKYRSLNNKR